MAESLPPLLWHPYGSHLPSDSYPRRVSLANDSKAAMGAFHFVV